MELPALLNLIDALNSRGVTEYSDGALSLRLRGAPETSEAPARTPGPATKLGLIEAWQTRQGVDAE